MKLIAIKNFEMEFNFEIDDPSGNSFISNPFAPH